MIKKLFRFPDELIDRQFKHLIDELTNAPSWIAPTLTNAWANNGAPYAAAGYFKDIFSIVRLKGLVKNGVAANIFTLPIEYCPIEQMVFAVQGAGAYANVEITTAGIVKVTTAIPANVSLDGITFRTF